MKADAVKLLAGVAHHHFGPVVIRVGWPAGHFHDLDSFGNLDESSVAARDVGGIFSPHVSAAAPELIAKTEVGHFPGSLAAISGSLVGEGACG